VAFSSSITDACSKHLRSRSASLSLVVFDDGETGKELMPGQTEERPAESLLCLFCPFFIVDKYFSTRKIQSFC